MQKEIYSILEKTKIKNPLIHFITNYVSVNDCANLTLSLGASPIMADAIEEVEEIVLHSCALVLNIGTLNTRTLQAMLKAGKMANQKGIPVLLDPVGAGTSRFRNEALNQILGEIQLSVIKGNASELAYLAGTSRGARGVDVNPKDSQIGVEVFKNLAKQYQCVCAITGKKDLILDQNRVFSVENGVAELSLITGSGCMISAMIGAFLGSGSNPLDASLAGVGIMGIAGEIAKEKGGNFKIGVLDCITQASQLLEFLKVDEVRL